MASNSVSALKDKQLRRLWPAFLILAAILAVFFLKSFGDPYVVFSNDGPLGAQMAESTRLPTTFTGGWQDLNSIGFRTGGALTTITYGLLWLLGPVGYAKFYASIALLILGLAVWFFFRELELSPSACILGGLAAVLSSGFFSSACWGVAAQDIAYGLNFCALGLALNQSRPYRKVRLALAGFCVGMGVMEGFDIGAIFSVLTAVVVFYHSLLSEEGFSAKRAVAGLGRVAIIAACAGFIAAQALVVLVGTQIEGVAGTQQNTRTKDERWDYATTWSFPKREVLGLIVPGLFGYRMDTPQNMEFFESWFENGSYWGAIGRDPAWDRYFADGGQGPPPSLPIRFSGGGSYEGVLVLLIGLWAAMQAFRKQDSVFSISQRRFLQFWIVTAVISLLLAFGRFAPFYRLVYTLPYFSTIRNPIKFLSVFNWCLLILFGFGVHGISRRYLTGPLPDAASLGAQLKKWWMKTASSFEKRWVFGCAIAVAASVVGWLVYATSRHSLEQYLQTVQFDETMAHAIAGFSIRQVGWFILFLVLGTGLMVLIFSGALAGRRAKLGVMLMGLFLVADLGRADLPWIVYWNYQQKYETSGPNLVIQFFRQKPWEQRVTILPGWILQAFQVPQQVAQVEARLNGLYGIEWEQQLFQYYNIQSLDVVQMPRMPQDLENYQTALLVRSAATLPNQVRHWELTNTRYILGFAGFLDLLNKRFDPGHERFRIAERFDIVNKPGVTMPTQYQDLTAELSTNGMYAVFDFTGALPRAKLYSRWEINTNDQATLEQLTSPSFDPAQTVLVSSAVPGATNAEAAPTEGTVEISSYAPKEVKLQAKAAAPSVLLLNDKYDPNWQVWVDGKRAELLRCNYIMRGVFLKPGSHRVEFVFRPPVWPLYVSLAAIGIAVLLLGYLGLAGKPRVQEAGPSAAQSKNGPNKSGASASAGGKSGAARGRRDRG